MNRLASSSPRSSWKLLAALSLTLIAAPASAEQGIASIYGDGDGYAWKRTANGERMNPGAMNAAHRTLPFGTRVLVRNRGNGRAITVRINDRGPFRRGRIIDLTPVAAYALGCDGLCNVTVSAQ